MTVAMLKAPYFVKQAQGWKLSRLPARIMAQMPGVPTAIPPVEALPPPPLPPPADGGVPLDSTMAGAAVGNSILPGWGTAIGAGIGLLVDIFE